MTIFEFLQLPRWYAIQMNDNQLSPDILKTKQHFEILDGLRGIGRHSGGVYSTLWNGRYFGPQLNFIGHGFLAVDFFFVFQAFVVSYTYDRSHQQKWG